MNAILHAEERSRDQQHHLNSGAASNFSANEASEMPRLETRLAAIEEKMDRNAAEISEVKALLRQIAERPTAGRGQSEEVQSAEVSEDMVLPTIFPALATDAQE